MSGLHPMCEDCWLEQHREVDKSGRTIGVTRLPHRTPRPDPLGSNVHKCCFCGAITISDIFVADPVGANYCDHTT